MDRYLSGVDPHKFDELVAYEQAGLDPMTRLREILKLGLSAIACGLKISPAEIDTASEPAEPYTASPQEAVAMMRQHYGR